MLDKDALPVVMDILSAESFYADAHQLIFKAVLRLFEKSQPIDMLTVSESLKKSGDFKLMVFNNDDASVSKDFKKYLRKNKLKTMARVKSDNSKAAFYILEENDIVKEIILRANSDDEKLDSIVQHLKDMEIDAEWDDYMDVS